MNQNIEIEPIATVRWNALEGTILRELLEDPGDLSEVEYTKGEMMALNAKIAMAMDPESETWTVPDRFQDPDSCGTRGNPLKGLFDKTETLLANLERARTLGQQFHYDEHAEL